MDTGREEQRGRLRAQPLPKPDVIVVRGGPDSLAKLRVHVVRTARAWSLDGMPLFGVSVFCALDDIGVGSLDALLAGRLRTYRTVHFCRVADLEEVGVELLPTGTRPHFTAVLGSDRDDRLLALLARLGPARDNRGGPASGRRPGR